MFPLDVVLIGRDEERLPYVRRELLKNEAVVTAEYADARSAVEGLNKAESPRLFVVHVDDEDDVAGLRRLCLSFPREPLLAVVSESTLSSVRSDATSRDLEKLLTGNVAGCEQATVAVTDSHPLFVPAMRAGAMQVVPAPIEPRDFQQALDCLATHFGQPSKSIAIAVAGVVGGCGSTTLAANLGYELALLTGKHVIACELTPRMGTLASYLDIQPEFTVDSLFDSDHIDVYALRNGLTRVAENFDVLCGRYRTIDLGAPSAEEPRVHREMLEIIDGLKRLAEIVVVDVPPTLDQVFFDVLAQADRLVLVTEQSLASLRSLRNVYELLEGGGAQHPEVVLNRYRQDLPAAFSAEALREKIGLPHVSTVAEDHLAITGSQNQGRVLRMFAPQSEVLSDIDRLAGRLVEVNSNHKESPQGLWRRLTKACGM